MPICDIGQTKEVIIMTYIVTTQILENYGSHDADGKFESGNAYWKFKGGTDYQVTGVDRPADAMAFIMAVFGQDEISFKEMPTKVKDLNAWLDDLPQDDDEWRDYLLDSVVHVDVKKFFDGEESKSIYHLAASAKGKTLID
jgi:hypothetical protein